MLNNYIFFSLVLWPYYLSQTWFYFESSNRMSYFTALRQTTWPWRQASSVWQMFLRDPPLTRCGAAEQRSGWRLEFSPRSSEPWPGGRLPVPAAGSRPTSSTETNVRTASRRASCICRMSWKWSAWVVTVQPTEPTATLAKKGAKNGPFGGASPLNPNFSGFSGWEPVLLKVLLLF